MANGLLVYHPAEAAEYGALLRQAGYPGPIYTVANEAEAMRHAPAAEILLAGNVPAGVLTAARNLRWIQSAWAGVEQWLALPLPERAVLTHMVGPFGPLISEYVFAFLLAELKQVHVYRRQQAAATWQPHRPERLHGLRLGIAGMGTIGAEIARVGRAFGMAVWGLSRTGAAHAAADRMFSTTAITEFAAGVDVLVSVLPDTPATRGLISREVLAVMLPTAFLINVGRGAAVDVTALSDALQNGRLRCAILDVFSQEPLPPDDPLWSLPGCVVTPHVAGPSMPADVVPAFMANFERYCSGESLQGVVDRQRGY